MNKGEFIGAQQLFVLALRNHAKSLGKQHPLTQEGAKMAQVAAQQHQRKMQHMAQQKQHMQREAAERRNRRDAGASPGQPPSTPWNRPSQTGQTAGRPPSTPWRPPTSAAGS